jgi:hypothetical protein
LQANLTYEPIIVRVNGQKAYNLTNYDGSPPSGFITSIPPYLQYRHFSDMINFPEQLGEDKVIEVSYNIKESTVPIKIVLSFPKLILV